MLPIHNTALFNSHFNNATAVTPRNYIQDGIVFPHHIVDCVSGKEPGVVGYSDSSKCIASGLVWRKTCMASGKDSLCQDRIQAAISASWLKARGRIICFFHANYWPVGWPLIGCSYVEAICSDYSCLTRNIMCSILCHCKIFASGNTQTPRGPFKLCWLRTAGLRRLSPAPLTVSDSPSR